MNRVILATDGDFNVGVTNQGDLIRLIEEKAKSGVFLSVLGVGTDNLKDSTMQKLADKGNGNYAYLDSLDEARKVLVQQMNGTLITIAKDVKIQVEFNPARVASYRLIGYEKRMLRKEDFNNDKMDAGEIGAGHTVTALYEVVPVGASAESGRERSAGRSAEISGAESARRRQRRNRRSPEMLTVKLRYKKPDGDKSQLIERSLTDDGREVRERVDRSEICRGGGGVWDDPARFAIQRERNARRGDGVGAGRKRRGREWLSRRIYRAGAQERNR